MKNVTLKVSDMSCEGCANAVKAALTSIEGVEQAQVSLEDKSARVRMEESVSPAELVAAVNAAGYTGSLDG